MNDLRVRLESWRAEGLITQDQAEAILTFEAAGSSPSRSRTTGAEAIGYVGAALTVGALLLLFGGVWADLLVVGRLALVGVLTAALLAGGLLLRSSGSMAVQRLTSVLLTAGVAGVAWFVGVVVADLLGLTGEVVAIASGTAAGFTAIALYALRARALLQLAILASVLTVAIALISLPTLPVASTWYGLVIAAVGAAWVLLGRGAWLEPRLLTDVVGAGLVLIGAQVASFESQRLVAVAAGVAVAALLVLTAVAFDELHLLVLGALGLFVMVPQLVFEIFGDVIGAPATLLLVGLLLVLLAVGLGRARREVTRGVQEGQLT